MSHVLRVSDETYRTIESLARQQGTTPEALARAAHGEDKRYASTDAFFATLDEIPVESTDE